MARAEFHGRMQKITVGRIRDFVTTYTLACDPQQKLDPTLLIFKDGQHSRIVERLEELDFLGNLDGIIIGIGGSDPSHIPPEQILPEWEEAARNFFDPDKNPLSYFQI